MGSPNINDMQENSMNKFMYRLVDAIRAFGLGVYNSMLIAVFGKSAVSDFYQVALPSVMKQLNDLGQVLFIDVGGYFGDVSYYVQKNSNQPNDIVIFEPYEKNFLKIKNRFRDFDNVSVHQLAVSSASGMSELNVYSHHGLNSLHVPCDDFYAHGEPHVEEVQFVPMVSLDEFIQVPSNPIFLKIDVQGHELEVLKGAQSLLKSGAIQGVLLEVSLQKFYDGSQDASQLVISLLQSGFSIKCISYGYRRKEEILEYDIHFVKSN